MFFRTVFSASLFQESSMVKYVLAIAVLFGVGLYLEGKDPAPPSADQTAAMQAFMASMQPGKQHAELAKLAGDWDSGKKHWDCQARDDYGRAIFARRIQGDDARSAVPGDVFDRL
jgi:hypothetical protein